MKISRRFARRKNELDRGRVIGATLIQLFQAFQTVTGARMLVAHAREFRFRIADRLVTAHDSVDSRLAFALQASDTGTRFGEFEGKLFGFEFSFGVLAGGAV